VDQLPLFLTMTAIPMPRFRLEDSTGQLRI